ncbi:Type IV fimbrial biogenesis protein PilY1 [Labilithrix luteola]|uniref:Type IV fimbrial biogenesis protein PilY1 n=1 Tax=Labilithrix luteola TaxID=1391654 RepID=A0A0K1Q5R7_9BACT|nr:hypothetical protein [Labilithrix luteola]AKV01074.1 Type IV fimbrial biogenesis protein PilY1 [Labilithrix luteola]
MKVLVATSSTAFALSVLAVASCAESTASSPREEAGTIPEASLPGEELDAGADGAADADCAAEEGGCTARALTCEEADFCTVPTSVDPRYALFGVSGSSERDVWAVGSAGTVAHWDGIAWSNVPLDRKDSLLGVWAGSANDVWIVSSLNVVLHSTGFGSGPAAFTEKPPIDPDDPTNYSGKILRSVWGSGPNDVFVGGAATNLWPRNSMWRYVPEADGIPDTWEGASTFCNVGCTDVNALWGTRTNELWVVANRGRVLRSEDDGAGGRAWTSFETTATNADLRGVWGSSSSDVWVVGNAGTIRHWSNDSKQHWEVIASPTTENLRAVWGTGPSDAWAVGDAGTILHWNGKAWTAAIATLPLGAKPRLYGVWGSGTNDVWVVGEGIVLHFSGSKSLANGGTP